MNFLKNPEKLEKFIIISIYLVLPILEDGPHFRGSHPHIYKEIMYIVALMQ